MIGVRYGGRRATRSARMRAMTPVETSTTPETVHAATRAFGTDLRVEHYAVDPTRVGNLAGSTVAYILGS